ncbi:acetyl-CoA carboxylase biotin carboxyl carrier protein [Catenuloplanes atrovinosus]|uniref:Biotin carboxyl carrier protein of acetyl-CoA carboxylase n=1 Tax=Catenuloplanes atrovinosus TaxID=137266 RepID=A0AAE3YNH9_9ACTN|nr:biotin/lipoyl-containing protein [Catenuloplanes atrovinosus]MDR7276785.1 acetyl-CoA carboxylase biotin carboxyl carrier protein [Catenuloplanes atrovinosus]
MTDELDEACTSVARLLAASPAPVRRLRLQHGDLMVEMEWAETAAPEAAPAAVPRAPESSDAGLAYVSAPMVGVFYRAPKPGEEPFVREGDTVRPGQQVAIIEAMKIMIPVEAEAAGEVVKILAEDGSPVEYGEHLIAVAG